MTVISRNKQASRIMPGHLLIPGSPLSSGSSSSPSLGLPLKDLSSAAENNGDTDRQFPTLAIGSRSSPGSFEHSLCAGAQDVENLHQSLQTSQHNAENSRRSAVSADDKCLERRSKLRLTKKTEYDLGYCSTGFIDASALPPPLRFSKQQQAYEPAAEEVTASTSELVSKEIDDAIDSFDIISLYGSSPPEEEGFLTAYMTAEESDWENGYSELGDAWMPSAHPQDISSDNECSMTIQGFVFPKPPRSFRKLAHHDSDGLKTDISRGVSFELYERTVEQTINLEVSPKSSDGSFSEIPLEKIQDAVRAGTSIEEQLDKASVATPSASHCNINTPSSRQRAHSLPSSLISPPTRASLFQSPETWPSKATEQSAPAHYSPLTLPIDPLLSGNLSHRTGLSTPQSSPRSRHQESAIAEHALVRHTTEPDDVPAPKPRTSGKRVHFALEPEVATIDNGMNARDSTPMAAQPPIHRATQAQPLYESDDEITIEEWLNEERRLDVVLGTDHPFVMQRAIRDNTRRELRQMKRAEKAAAEARAAAAAAADKRQGFLKKLFSRSKAEEDR